MNIGWRLDARIRSDFNICSGSVLNLKIDSDEIQPKRLCRL